MRAIVVRTQTCFCLIQKSHTNKSVFKNLYLRLLLPSTLRLPPPHIKLRLMYGGRLTECQLLDETSYYNLIPIYTAKSQFICEKVNAVALNLHKYTLDKAIILDYNNYQVIAFFAEKNRILYQKGVYSDYEKSPNHRRQHV